MKVGVTLISFVCWTVSVAKMINHRLWRITRNAATSPTMKLIRKKIEIRIWRKAFDVLFTPEPESGLGVKRVLIVTSIGENANALALDSVLAKALESRGCDVFVLLCDGVLDACMNCEIRKFKGLKEFQDQGAHKLCQSCVTQGAELTSIAGLNVLHFSSFLGVELGEPNKQDLESAQAGALRFLAIGDKSAEEFLSILPKFITASVQARTILEKCISEMNIDIVLAHHGIYVPQGSAVSAAQNLGKRVVTWSQSYRRGTYLFSHSDTAHKMQLQEKFTFKKLSDEERYKTIRYLESRDAGSNDWIRFGLTVKDRKEFLEDILQKPMVLLLTNVNWDAQVHFGKGLFTNMEEWLLETIEWFTFHSNLQLVVRLHPAEISGTVPTREPMERSIRSKFPKLPTNIVIVTPDSEISTYSLIERADLGIIYGTKTGVELVSSGVPTIVAGEAWIKNKDLTLDPLSKSEYFQHLEDFAKGNSVESPDVEKALSYAHHFFFRRMIEINSIKPIPYYPYARPQLKVDWEETDPGLVKVINSILSGDPFEF